MGSINGQEFHSETSLPIKTANIKNKKKNRGELSELNTFWLLSVV